MARNSPLRLSLLWLIAAAASARGAGEVIIEDFSSPVDAFFLDDGTAAGLPSSGDSGRRRRRETRRGRDEPREREARGGFA